MKRYRYIKLAISVGVTKQNINYYNMKEKYYFSKIKS